MWNNRFWCKEKGHPTNTPHVFHVETIVSTSFQRRIHMMYLWVIAPLVEIEKQWPYKKHSKNSQSSLFLQQQKLKMKRIWKIFYKNRNYFKTLEDEKFNPWKKKKNLQNSSNFSLTILLS